jgi:Holliday junction resolvasome RuvABC endonuclease subunit
MRIVGVDPGKTTGVAIVDVTEGGWTLHSRADLTPEGDSRGEQLANLHGRFTEGEFGGATYVMEEMLAYRQATADEKVEAQAVVKLAAYHMSNELVTYAPATVRSVICRDGRADERTIRETLKFLARAPQRAKKGEGWSNHQLDALAVALCHLARSGMVLDRCREGVK